LVSGEVYCWGDATSGKLGNGTTSGTFLPQQVEDASGPIQAVAVSVGAAHSCALSPDGAVWCWGSNFQGGLGDPSVIGTSAVAVQTLGSGEAIALGSGWNHSCAVHPNGTASCWGSNNQQ